MIRIGVSALALLLGVTWAAAPAPARASSYQVLYSFHGGSDGALPMASLIDVGGTLYGTTFQGGASFGGAVPCNCGTVFSLNLTTGIEKILFTFNAVDYGSPPAGSLIDVGGILYGMTSYGPLSGGGVIFSLDPATGAVKALHDFKGGSDGAFPYDGLIEVGGRLYGTTAGGGAHSRGTIFRLDPQTGVEKVVYSFKSSGDGVHPEAGLINVGDTLYGTTTQGGSYKLGTVFSFNRPTHTEKVLYSFAGGEDGANPYDDLINIDGTLYGTAASERFSCRSDTCGTVFSLNPVTGAETVLHRFPPRGGLSFADLIKVGDKLRGTTQSGGSDGFGTVFSLSLTTDFKKDLYSFQGGNDGRGPRAGLVDIGGTLYGTTSGGGTYGYGTVFAITP